MSEVRAHTYSYIHNLEQINNKAESYGGRLNAKRNGWWGLKVQNSYQYSRLFENKIFKKMS